MGPRLMATLKGDPLWPQRTRRVSVHDPYRIRPAQGAPPLQGRLFTPRTASGQRRPTSHVASQAGSAMPSEEAPRSARARGEPKKYLPGALTWLYEQPEKDVERASQWIEGRPPSERGLLTALRTPMQSIEVWRPSTTSGSFGMSSTRSTRGPPSTPCTPQSTTEARNMVLEYREGNVTEINHFLKDLEAYLPSKSPLILAGRRRLDRIQGLPPPESPDLIHFTASPAPAPAPASPSPKEPMPATK